MDELGNNSIPASEIKLLPFEEITEKMLYAPDIHHCIEIIEPYLLRLAMKHHSINRFTEQAALEIIRERGVVSINKLASGSYLSVSQLEKNFIKKIGVSPKVYAWMQGQDLFAEQRKHLESNIAWFRKKIAGIPSMIYDIRLPVCYIKEPDLYAHCLRYRILLSAFRYPSEQDPLMARVVLNALHTREDIERLGECIHRFYESG